MPLFLTLAGGRLSGSDRIRQVAIGQTLSIGRGADNDWVLPDPSRIVGRLHCTVSGADGRFVLTDLSANGIYINDSQQATARDSRIVLTDGDQFRLGDYVVSVAEVDDEPIGRGNTATGRREQPFGGGRESRDPLSADPFSDPPAEDPRGDTFARKPDPVFQHPVAHVPAKPRDADPFDRKDQRPANRRIEPDDDLFRGLTPSSDWHGAPVPDHAPAPQHAMPLPRVTAPTPPGEIDFDALLGDLLPISGAAASPRPGAPAPRPGPPQAPEPRTAAPVPQAPAGADAKAALAAFLAGAGVQGQNIDDSDPEAALRAAGEIFRAMADGIREILISRAAIKGEMRVTQTMIRAHGNNALKFSATPDDAVVSLLTPKRPGYMEPLAAAREAFSDIKSHEMAVIAGMQNALLALLRRFDPNALEERLTRGRLDAVLPAARKARYWDAFRVTYGEISREAEDDFQAAFGRSFATAYKALTNKRRQRED